MKFLLIGLLVVCLVQSRGAGITENRTNPSTSASLHSSSLSSSPSSSSPPSSPYSPSGHILTRNTPPPLPNGNENSSSITTSSHERTEGPDDSESFNNLHLRPEDHASEVRTTSTTKRYSKIEEEENDSPPSYHDDEAEIPGSSLRSSLLSDESNFTLRLNSDNSPAYTAAYTPTTSRGTSTPNGPHIPEADGPEKGSDNLFTIAVLTPLAGLGNVGLFSTGQYTIIY